MYFRNLSRSEKIFSILRDRIIYMEYPSGKLLPEKELCAEFKVSRTPLREAIQKLKEMKLVTVIPRFGTYVSSVDINEIRSAFEVKINLEGLAGEVAARRITPDKLAELKSLIERADGLLKESGHRHLIEIDSQFHEIMYQATQNPILLDILENLHGRCARLWNSALGEIIPLAAIINQLKEIYSSLEKRESAKARQLMEDHVRYFIDQIKKQLL
jgi:GntR family transcriptional regulator, rspAB operon transcriptional repressor